jgi:non-specific serine/threonine protein kinase
MTGNFAEGVAWLQQLLQVDDHGHAQLGGRPPSPVIAKALAFAGFLQMFADPAHGRILAEDALAMAQRLGDQPAIMRAAEGVGMTAHYTRDPARAREALELSLSLGRELHDPSIVHTSLYSQAFAVLELGELTLARQLLEENIALCQQDGDRLHLAWSLRRLATVHVVMRDVASAQQALRDSLAISRTLPEEAGIAPLLEGFAMVAAAAGHPQRALRLAGAADALRDRTGRLPLEQAALDARLDPARQALDEAEATAAFLEGHALRLDAALEYAESGAAEPQPPTNRAAVAKRGIPLSPREVEVVQLITQGWTNRRIAEGLVISEGTAKRHLENILTKLGLDSRAQVAAWAVDNRVATPASAD